MLGWWYLSGWAWLSKGLVKRLYSIQEIFSVGILAKTLFSPWKQIQTPSSFQNFFQAAADNLVSRFVGATARIFVLIAALIIWIVTLLAGIICIIFWPVVPLLFIILPLMAITGVELF